MKKGIPSVNLKKQKQIIYALYYVYVYFIMG